MSKMIELIKDGQSRFVSEYEYNLVKDDMSGWEVNHKAPAVPTEVAQRIATPEEKTRKNAKQ